MQSTALSFFEPSSSLSVSIMKEGGSKERRKSSLKVLLPSNSVTPEGPFFLAAPQNSALPASFLSLSIPTQSLNINGHIATAPDVDDELTVLQAGTTFAPVAHSEPPARTQYVRYQPGPDRRNNEARRFSPYGDKGPWLSLAPFAKRLANRLSQRVTTVLPGAPRANVPCSPIQRHIQVKSYQTHNMQSILEENVNRLPSM